MTLGAQDAELREQSPCPQMVLVERWEMQKREML